MELKVLTLPGDGIGIEVTPVPDSGRVTADLRPAGPPATTSEVGEAVCAAIG